MKNNNPKKSLPTKAAELRRQAEARLQAGQQSAGGGDTEQMLHELRVHQIELEVQNEELRRAQVELDALRARYFTLYDLAPVGNVTVSDKGLIQEVNLTASTLLGAPKSQLVNQPFSKFITAENQEHYYLDLRRLVTAGQPLMLDDLQIVKADGTRFWGQLSGNSTTDANGVAVIYFILSDSSARKQAEAELLATKELAQQKTTFFKSIIESPKGVIIFALDYHYRYTEFTPLHQTTMRNIWGCEIAVGLNMLEVISNPADRA
ncbi:MAG: PAS domain S-box protein, partial [Verrucomicrobiota bacterium]